jgi:hypothetical protein
VQGEVAPLRFGLGEELRTVQQLGVIVLGDAGKAFTTRWPNIHVETALAGGGHVVHPRGPRQFDTYRHMPTVAAQADHTPCRMARQSVHRFGQGLWWRRRKAPVDPVLLEPGETAQFQRCVAGRMPGQVVP